MALVKRGSNYHFRRRIPKDVTVLIGLTEVCRSLGTSNRATNKGTSKDRFLEELKECTRIAQSYDELIIKMKRSARVFFWWEALVPILLFIFAIIFMCARYETIIESPHNATHDQISCYSNIY